MLGTGRNRQPRKGPYFAKRQIPIKPILVGLALITPLFVGMVYYWVKRSHGEDEFIEIFATDSSEGERNPLLVSITEVNVGDDHHRLVLDESSVDFSKLGSQAEPVRIAYGYVDPGDHQQVQLVFGSASVTIAGQSSPVLVPEPKFTILHDLGLSDHAGVALLVEFDSQESLERNGLEWSLAPYVSAVFLHAYESSGDIPSGPAGAQDLFGDAPPTTPLSQSLGDPDELQADADEAVATDD